MKRDELIGLGVRLAAPFRIAPPNQPGRGPMGVFAGSRDGQSVDFHDYREYLPGDDLRKVDWRAYARNGQMQLKLFREEVSPVVELCLDDSASMGAYAGKEQAAVFVASFLRAATLAAEGRPALCLGPRRYAGRDFDAALAGTDFTGVGDDGMPPPSASGRPLRFYLSDFLFGEGAAGSFRRQAAGSLLFTPVLIHSRSERDPGWRGHHRLYDVEQPGRTLDLSMTTGMVATYRARLKKHVESLAVEAERLGGRLVSLDVPDEGLTREDCERLVRRLAAERLVAVRGK